MLPMAAHWIPPADRSKFMSNMMGESNAQKKYLFKKMLNIIEKKRDWCTVTIML